MDTTKRAWNDQDTQTLVNLRASGIDWDIIGDRLERTREACRYRYMVSKKRVKPTMITESPFPKYDEPLVMEGDALIIPDIEIPFHHAEFVNRCLELAQAWGIRQAIFAGDVLHFDSISSWEPNWMVKNHNKSALTDQDEADFIEFAKTLGSRQQERAFNLLEKMSGHFEDGDPNISQELGIARKELKVFTQLFDLIDFILGNHEGRMLNSLQSPMFADELLVLLKLEGKWRISPHYFSYLISNGERFQIEHPKSAAKIAPYKLAAKFNCHIMQAHSHLLNMGFDPSGKYYAWHIGCCVDELRLPYASQRHTTADAHLRGAVIIRDGVPWALHERVDWTRLTRC